LPIAIRGPERLERPRFGRPFRHFADALEIAPSDQPSRIFIDRWQLLR